MNIFKTHVRVLVTHKLDLNVLIFNIVQLYILKTSCSLKHENRHKTIKPYTEQIKQLIATRDVASILQSSLKTKNVI